MMNGGRAVSIFVQAGGDLAAAHSRQPTNGERAISIIVRAAAEREITRLAVGWRLMFDRGQ